ncbi:N-alpha-acetyltransferase 80-like [Asterias amurensis]|uniref:N-alpha-acetyltransferase 80-like n=1 Tax=Asterias amurensis TaxID=7602 RepID=UPI003AB7BAA8
MTCIQTVMSEISCLHSRPDLIASCSSLLLSVWPYTKTERLQLLENENCTGFPCSLVLIDQKENQPDFVIGHIRLAPCIEPPESVYLEAFCIDPSRTGRGLGSKLLKHAEEYAVSVLGLKQAIVWCETSLMGYYSKQSSYQKHLEVDIQTVGGNILGEWPEATTWPGNVPPTGWECEFEEGRVATEDDLKDFIVMSKYLGKN